MTYLSHRPLPKRSPRAAFTLVEMTIVVMVIAILAALALPVFVTAQTQARAHRTRAIVAKIDQIIGEKYDSYRTRQVAVKIPMGRYPNGQPYMQPIGEPYAETANDNNLTNGFRDNSESFTDQPWNGINNGQYDLGASEYRLLAMRELQRLELPNQIVDVANNPLIMPFGPPGIINSPIFPRPALSKQYLRRALSLSPNTPPDLTFWTPQYEGAECLYLILAVSRDNEKSALDYFSPSEIGDFDGDGMKEVLDGWGQPIEFVRWPTGYRNDITPAATTPQDSTTPDPFDPFKVDGRTRNGIFQTVALKPLVYSAGPDKQYRIGAAAAATFLADPYRVDYSTGLGAGSPLGTGFEDNITNHDLEAR